MDYRRFKVPGAQYFFTVVTYQRQPILTSPDAIRSLERAIHLVQAKRPFLVEAQVTLPDHLHAIWKLPEGDADYPTRWRLIKEGFTREFGCSLPLRERDARQRRRGECAVWQRRYWEHLIRDDRDFTAHVEYIHFNPVKHGLAAAPKDWPYSTFSGWVQRGLYDQDWGTSDMPSLPDWVGRE